MPILIAIVAVVGVLCLLNILLTVGVIRRIREHTALLTDVSVPDSPIIGVPTGEAPSEFVGTTTTGETVTADSNLRVVAFFSASCSICPERAPLFVDYLKKHKVPADRVLAVVGGQETKPTAYFESLLPVAQVVSEAEDGPLSRAFKVVGFPAFALLDEDGNVMTTGYNPTRLPEPALAMAAK